MGQYLFLFVVSNSILHVIFIFIFIYTYRVPDGLFLENELGILNKVRIQFSIFCTYLSKLVATCRKMCQTKKLIMHQYSLHHQWIYSSNFCEGLCCCLPMSRSAFARRYLSFLFYLIQYASILIDDRLVNNLLLAFSDFNIFLCPKNCCKDI